MLFLHSTIDGVWQAGEVIQLILGILLFVSDIAKPLLLWYNIA